MTVEELLLAMKDIAPPPEPPWWLLPPAYLVSISVIIIISGVTWFTLRYRRANRLALQAEQELQRIRASYDHNQDTLQLGLELSRWLKQVAILAFPQRQISSLTGENWLQFLDNSLGGNSFSSGDGRVFAEAIYRQHVDIDAQRLVELCERWLINVKPCLLERGRE